MSCCPGIQSQYADGVYVFTDVEYIFNVVIYMFNVGK